MRVPYFLLMGIAMVAVYMINGKYFKEELTIYGFAETKETEINLNYPVLIDDLRVIPGESVDFGDTILVASRLDPELKFEDQNLRISEIKAKKSIWIAEQRGKLDILQSDYQSDIAELEVEINTLNAKLEKQKSLYEGLKSINVQDSIASNHPILLELEELSKLKDILSKKYNIEKSNIEGIIRRGTYDDDQAINRLSEEYKYRQESKSIPIVITAPSIGLIGNVHCKEGEHITDYRTLISFYEPNPTLVKAYVHEDYVVNVSIGDKFQISSTKDENLVHTGEVVGLGSRIIEIPARMRKVPEYKVYGREVIVRLPAESMFLQNEKLILKASTDR